MPVSSSKSNKSDKSDKSDKSENININTKINDYIYIIKQDNEYIGLNELDFNTYSLNNIKKEDEKKEENIEKAFSKDLLTIIKEYKNNNKNTKKRKRRRRKKRPKYKF